MIIPLEEVDILFKTVTFVKEKKRARIFSSLAQSLDGKIALKSGFVKLTGSKADYFMHKKRLIADVLITTAQTITKDNPQFNVRLKDHIFPKKVAIIDSKLVLKGDEKIFKLAEEVHIFTKKTSLESYSQKNIFYHQVAADEDDKLKAEEIFKKLYDMGFYFLWVESGSHFNKYLYDNKLVDSSYLFIAPKILGKNGVDAYLYDCHLSDSNFSVCWNVLEQDVVAYRQWNL